MQHPPEPPSRTATVIRIKDSIKSRNKRRRLVKAVRAATEAAMEQANPGTHASSARGVAGPPSRRHTASRRRFRAGTWAATTSDQAAGSARTAAGTARAAAGSARAAAGVARDVLTVRTARVAQAVQAKFGATTRGATQSESETSQQIRFVRTSDPGGTARFVCTSDTTSRTHARFRKGAYGGQTGAHSAATAASSAADAVNWLARLFVSGFSNLLASRALRRLAGPLRRIEIERPTKVILALTGVFAALICVPAVSAWSIHRTSPDLVGRWINSVDAQTTISVYRIGSGTVSHVPLNNYIVNVLAAELPPTAPMQSLEAAAVATRTYIVYLMAHKGAAITSIAAQHGALVTDDPLLDLPWLTEAQQVQKYGANDATYTARLQEAVIATDGKVLTYQGSPIPAFMFALSPGRTRNASAVFGRNMPYLPSVACPADQADPAATRTLTFTPAQLASHLGLASGTAATGGTASGGASTTGGAGASTSTGGASTSATSKTGASKTGAAKTGVTTTGIPKTSTSPSRTNTAAAGTAASRTGALNPAAFTVSSRGSEGFVQTINMKGSLRAWTGIDFANRLGLPSADFTLAVQGGNLVVTTRGIGTDIGMSLHEATVLAAGGDSWKAIVSHFYPGTTTVSDLPFLTGK
ncbi:SpoIID/LytB domain-containing protein [Alicyclobacillus sp. ALC3]|uniref:SpoIID/LytB domain-containing protein n=1 Tax=Alicyclobacillus sp. ALC3 TaxID=2796143 RepID=UPI00237932A9|nr:SpoIID/LytB domain-containing protein [Alicyclobacillus sp. ALC3]WDL95222.1 SpoIID/LytB domain-containing protein [Alicyclobacillus sp. ALC3]